MRSRVAVVAVAVAVALVATACAANPWPSAAPPPAAPHTVLALGDSLIPQMLWGMQQPRNSSTFGNVTLIDEHVNASGLVGPVGDAPDALSYVKEKLAAHPETDTVMIEWLGDCYPCAAAPYPAWGSPAFYDQWEQNAKAVIDYVKSTGRYVVWTKSPPLLDGMIGSDVVARLAQDDEQIFQPETGVSGIDLWTALTGVNGGYQQWLYYDDAWHWVRYYDNIHLTEDGGIRAGAWAVRGLSDVWANSPRPTPAPAP